MEAEEADSVPGAGVDGRLVPRAVEIAGQQPPTPPAADEDRALRLSHEGQQQVEEPLQVVHRGILREVGQDDRLLTAVVRVAEHEGDRTAAALLDAEQEVDHVGLQVGPDERAGADVRGKVVVAHGHIVPGIGEGSAELSPAPDAATSLPSHPFRGGSSYVRPRTSTLPSRRGPPVNSVLPVDDDRAPSQPRAALAAVGTAEHTTRVAAAADLLVNRLLAVRAIGQLDAELQGLGTEESWLTS